MDRRLTSWRRLSSFFTGLGGRLASWENWLGKRSRWERFFLAMAIFVAVFAAAFWGSLRLGPPRWDLEPQPARESPVGGEVSPLPEPAAEVEKVTATETKSASRAADTPESSGDKEPGKMVSPAPGEISVTFGWIRSATYQDWRFHQGVDIKGPVESEVRAVLAGKVVSVEQSAERGYVVVLEHDGGLQTVYANNLMVSVKPGQRVEKSQVIGRTGDRALAEVAEGPHLHFEVWQQGKAVDPKLYLP